MSDSELQRLMGMSLDELEVEYQRARAAVETWPRFIVRCGDAKVRHGEPFTGPTGLADAHQFAEWGHICTAAHMVEELAEEGPR